MTNKKNENKDLTINESITDLAFPELTNIQLQDSFKQLVEVMPEHNQMLTTIKESLPEVQRATSLFYKTQSQFMDNMLTVSANTPIRNLRQILAEMNKTRDAIKENVFKLKKKEIELKKKKRELNLLLDCNGNLQIGFDELDVELLDVEIAEIMSQQETTKGYISGAIRKLSNYTEQYTMILEKHGLTEFSESDFEKEEARYHIMKSFEQALCAARSRHGMIDEGNMIYFTQIGINGAHAQAEVSGYLKQEAELIKEGKAPTHKMYRLFLERMADIFQDNAEELAEYKGMKTVTKTALIEKGDTRMLLQNKTKK